MQNTRHPSSERFHQLLAEIGVLHDAKQRDYGTNDDPFANVRSSSAWGMPAWVGAMVRATDKVKRLQTLASRGSLGHEPAVDAFKDLAVYALIGLVLFEEESANRPDRAEQVRQFLARPEPQVRYRVIPPTTSDSRGLAVEEMERHES
jgi:hypothetical protein